MGNEEKSVSLYTISHRQKLKQKASQDITFLKTQIENLDPKIIADVGANVGYYSEILLDNFPKAIIHAYEPHPAHIKCLQSISNERLILHPYGLFNDTVEVEFGMESDKRQNNGTYGIYNTSNKINVQLKNANLENFSPDFVKIDVEGSEAFVLKCEKFFEKTKLILIEILKDDPFKQNEKIKEELKNLGFSYKLKIGKNDYVWTKP